MSNTHKDHAALFAVLSSLADNKQAIEDITERSQERLQNYLEAQRNAGKQPDPSEVTRLRQQTRAELQRILSPPQLEEFLLRLAVREAEFPSISYPKEYASHEEWVKAFLALGDRLSFAVQHLEAGAGHEQQQQAA